MGKSLRKFRRSLRDRARASVHQAEDGTSKMEDSSFISRKTWRYIERYNLVTLREYARDYIYYRVLTEILLPLVSFCPRFEN